MDINRFLEIDSLPKEFSNRVVEKKQDTCVFCSSNDDYYSDIVREWYDVEEKTEYPRGLNPEKCPHDEWLVNHSIDIMNFFKNVINQNDSNYRNRGVSLADANPYSPKDVLRLLADIDTMEFVILEKVEFQRVSLEEGVMQESRLQKISITFEQFQEIYEILQKKSKLVSKGGISLDDARNDIYDFVKVLDSSITKQSLSKIFLVLEKFEDKELQDYLGLQAIEMLKKLQSFIVSLDYKKYDHETEGQKYRLPEQWQYNLYHTKKERDEFYTWLKEIEKRLGRKTPVIDKISNQLN